MQVCRTLTLMASFTAVSLSIPSAARPQEQTATSPVIPAATSTYSNTKEGLQELIGDIRAASKQGDEARVRAYLKDTEIPTCDVWLHKTYETDKADSWTGLCDAKTLGSKEQSLKELFDRIAKLDGTIITRKVNDNPRPGKGLEWGWLQAIKQPLDIYWASWLPSSEPKESEADPIGYFMFIDGGFRWESSIESYRPSQTKRANIVIPKLIKKVDPVYPVEAAANHISGTVRVHFVIGTDGVVHIIPHATEEGFSDDPDLVKAAEDAVQQWRYLPLTIDGKPLPLDFKADVVFAVKN